MTAKNVQRGLAQKVQDMSGMFRKKQRVYMQSSYFSPLSSSPSPSLVTEFLRPSSPLCNEMNLLGWSEMCSRSNIVFRTGYKGRYSWSRAELQGHAIKNKDLLAASGAITLKGAEGFDELAEDEMAVCPILSCYHLPSYPNIPNTTLLHPKLRFAPFN